MKIGKRLMGILFEQAPEDVTSPAVSQEEVQEVAPEASAQVAQVAPDDSVVQELREDIHRDYPKPYQRFLEQCKILESAIADEGTLMKTALATLKSEGVTEEHLRSAVADSFETLREEEAELVRELDAAHREDVGTKEHRLQEVETELAEIAAKLQQLSAEQSELQAGIAAGRSRDQSARSRAKAAVEVVRLGLERDRDRIMRHFAADSTQTGGAS